MLVLDTSIQVAKESFFNLDNSDLAVVSTASAVSQQQEQFRVNLLYRSSVAWLTTKTLIVSPLAMQRLLHCASAMRLLSQRNVSCFALRPSVKHWNDKGLLCPPNALLSIVPAVSIIKLAPGERSSYRVCRGC